MLSLYGHYKYFSSYSAGRGGGGGVGARVMVNTAAFHARVRGSFPGLDCLKETKMFLPHPRPRGSVLGLGPLGFEFRILCLEGSVLSLISPSSGGSPGPI